MTTASEDQHRYKVIETGSNRPEMETVHTVVGEVLSKKIRQQIEWANPDQAQSYADGMNRMRKHQGKHYKVVRI